MIVQSPSKKSPTPIKTRLRPVVQGAAAFSKGIAVMQLISEFPDPPSINELMEASDLTRPTLYRLLKALESEGLIECTNKKRFKLGARLLQFASRAFEQNDISRTADPELRLLANVTKETCYLAIRCGSEMIYIAKQDSPQTIRLHRSIGNRVPLHASAIGKCLMAHLNPEERNHLVDNIELTSLTPFSITNRETLLEQLEEIARTGYAVAHQETDLDVHCFGAVIKNRSGEPVGGMSVSVPLYRLSSDHSRYIQPLLAACQRVSQSLIG
jgi:DNA-binding IclR family transcriptional regulator